MVEAACQKAPNLKPEKVKMIVQAALDASAAEGEQNTVHDFIMPATLSAILTCFFILGSLAASGTWLDPRIWAETYVEGTTLAESFSNVEWIGSQALSVSPLVFIIIFTIAFAVRRMLKKHRT